MTREDYEIAHDQALYAYEGQSNIHLHPSANVQDAGYHGFESGFLLGWIAAQTNRKIEEHEVIQND